VGNLVKEFISIISAAKELNVGKSNISGVLNKKKKNSLRNYLEIFRIKLINNLIKIKYQSKI
jgi:hypothetical protein